MGEVIKVGMADLKTAKAPNTLTTLGLGSCIGLTLYDPVTKIGGLVHYMLPDSTKLKNNTNIAKFGDTGIRELLRQVLALGANQRRLVAKIAGGACMFEMSGLSSVGNVGARNAEEAKIILKLKTYLWGCSSAGMAKRKSSGGDFSSATSCLPYLSKGSDSNRGEIRQGRRMVPFARRKQKLF